MNRSIVNSTIYKGLLDLSAHVCLVLALMCGVLCVPRFANAEPSRKTGDQPDKSSIAALIDELDDIDFMRSLTPLKLTGEQTDKLAAAITDAKTQYDKKIADLSTSTVGEMADEIHKRHKEAVAGGAVSTEFDTKVQRVMKDFYNKRDVINKDNILGLTAACEKILTAEQKKIAEQMEKDTLVKMGKKPDPADADTKYLYAYVVDIFINYRRIVPLLKEMKPSA